jgi:hypothetical protein
VSRSEKSAFGIGISRHSRHLDNERHANRRRRHGQPCAGYLDASIVPDTKTCPGRSTSSGIEEAATTTVTSAANTCTNLQPHAARDPGNAWSPITNPCGRTVLQERLGQTAVRASFGTTPKMHVLLGNTDAALVAVLTLLQDELNLPFKTSYAGRLGNFEVFQLNSWLNRPQPFLIATRRDSIKNCAGPQVMEICRTRQFATVEHKSARTLSDINADSEYGAKSAPICINRLAGISEWTPMKPDSREAADRAIFDDHDGNNDRQTADYLCVGNRLVGPDNCRSARWHRRSPTASDCARESLAMAPSFPDLA